MAVRSGRKRCAACGAKYKPPASTQPLRVVNNAPRMRPRIDKQSSPPSAQKDDESQKG